MQVRPDHAGYRDAQERLRDYLGEAVVLLGPVQSSFPSGTALDPQTHQPFNPLIEPTSSAQASALIRGRVAFRGVPRNDIAPANVSALGFMEGADVAVIAGSAAASAASGATAMVIRDERYEIRASRFDGLVGVDRFLIFGLKEGP